MVKEFVNSVYVRGKRYRHFLAEDKIYSKLSRGLARHQFNNLKIARPNVLDIGCGFSCSISSSEVTRYLGLDLSVQAIAHHEFRSRSDTGLFVTDLNKYLPLNTKLKSWDLVYSVLALNYVEYPGDVLAQVRAPGASFLLVLPHQEFDARYGQIKDGVVYLQLENFQFRYFNHTLDDMVRWVQPVRRLSVAYCKPYMDIAPYVSVAGIW